VQREERTEERAQATAAEPEPERGRAVAGQNRGCGDVFVLISDGTVYNVTGFNGYKGGSLPSSQTQP